MPNGHKQEISGIERKISNLYTILRKLNDEKEMEELIAIIHRPGWTTPADFIFANTLVDGLTAHANAIASMKAGFVKGCSVVRAEEFAGAR